MKKWSHLSNFHVPFLSYGPYIVLKNAFFCNFVLTLARNISLLQQFTYMHLKGHLKQYCLSCYDLLFWRYLGLKLFWRYWGSATYKPCHFLKECKVYFKMLRCLDFLLRSAQNSKKSTFYHNIGWKHGNQTNDPIFFISFFYSNCLQGSFLYLKTVKIHFHVVSPLIHSSL